MTTATAESQTNEQDRIEAERPSYDDVNIPVLVLVGIISAILTFVIIAFVQGMCYHWQNAKIRSRSTETVNLPSLQVIEQQKSTLEGGDGIVPIDDAMQQVIEQFGKK